MVRKMTNFEMVNRLNLISQFEDKKLPRKISYAIMKNIVSLTSEYDIYNKQLKAIINRFKNENKVLIDEKTKEIITDESTGLPKVKDEYSKEFSTEITELLNFIVNIDICTVDEKDFDYEESDKYDALSAKEIFLLMDILVEKKEKSEENE